LGRPLRYIDGWDRGLLESAYQICLAFELRHLGIGVEEQQPLPVIYRDVKLDCGYRLDLVVEDSVVVEIKAVDQMGPIMMRSCCLTFVSRASGWGC
jgi:GxxExxY protein